MVLPKVRKVLEDANKGPKDADWQWCTRFISKYGEKETARRMELGGLDGGPLMIEHVLRENAKARQDGET